MSGLTKQAGDPPGGRVGDPHGFFSENFERKFFDNLIKETLERVPYGSHDDVFFSDYEFFSAMREADLDAQFMDARRGLDHGISEGKVAGILYFRLARAKIIYLGPKLSSQEGYRNIQSEILLILLGSLLHVDFNHPWVSGKAGNQRNAGMRNCFQDIYKELLYVTCRRHYNQESLALFFDSFVYLQHAIDEKLEAEAYIAKRLSDGPFDPLA